MLEPFPTIAGRGRRPGAAGRWARLFLLGLAGLVWASGASSPAEGAPPADYSTLKKFLTARMYCEAYLELLNLELARKEEDPRLTKLKKELLPGTRKEAEKRARLNPDDSAVFTILADVEFQEGRLDEAMRRISTARQGNPNALTHHIFARILFQKGNINQAFDEMEKALQADPSSEVIFEDFQFLYNCKNYGVASAKRLGGGAGFPRRATPVASTGSTAVMPDNPFENDPTPPPDVVLPPEPTPGQEPVVAVKPPEPPRPVEPPLPDEPDGGDAEPDDTEPFPPEPTPEPSPPPIKVASPSRPTVAEDPEKKRMKEADYWFEQARRKFESGDVTTAEETLAKAEGIYPGLPGRAELKQKIEEKKAIEKEYQFAKTLYENEKYDLARPGIQKAYDSNPEKFAEATFYLGKIYILGSERDLKKARSYFEKFLANPNVNPDLKRDVEWVMIGLLTDDQDNEEAYRRFHEFEAKEPEYARNQRTYWRLKYTLWYRHYRTEIHIGLAVFAGATLLVFLLMVVPSLGIFVFDPLKRAQGAFENQHFEKAVSIAEDALRRGKHPIQIQRQLLEICIQSHFALRNFFKCQDHAKHLLNLFPDNPIAWKYLAKAYLETNDTSEEAVTLYETIYRQNPENKEYLPILARHYATHKVYTVETMEIMYAAFQTDPNDAANVLALAEAYVQNKRMGDEVIAVLEAALKHKPEQTEFRELLARNYAKKGMYAEAARECLAILKVNINNMGIHVVYTTSMKKMNMLDEAILQYEEFLQKHPGNAQLAEIITGLRKELEASHPGGRDPLAPLEDLSPFAEDLLVDGLGDLGGGPLPTGAAQTDVEGFVEPPPEGFEPPDKPVPVPDFMKEGGGLAPSGGAPPAPAASAAPARSTGPTPAPPASPPPTVSDLEALEAIPIMDPFADHPDALLEPDGIGPQVPAGEPPAAPAGGAAGPVSKPKAVPSVPSAPPAPASGASRSGPKAPRPEPSAPRDEDRPEPDQPSAAAPSPAESGARPAAGGSAGKPAPVGEAEVAKARDLAKRGKWEEVVKLLTPVFASRRERAVGILLAEAYLKQRQPILAKEIVETLEFDRELMPEEVKDILYRVAVALEEAKQTEAALTLYDLICNVDINYRDAFDRSDRLYSQRKK
ncbi:MAG: putative Fe-S oxidoreductase [Candidatus Ozemobacter sibiricus]|uniref:Putative Fe-S oxidoreductase n=1 Tax=Candidatus Ozemobacter sibiricus TaxID=2268124 RepID=A0A367ZSH1_9BACT|nr:MAG: putative Fe-S oxidoreductase [Candidatus Ozemobacter sibiricus]